MLPARVMKFLSVSLLLYLMFTGPYEISARQCYACKPGDDEDAIRQMVLDKKCTYKQKCKEPEAFCGFLAIDDDEHGKAVVPMCIPPGDDSEFCDSPMWKILQMRAHGLRAATRIECEDKCEEDLCNDGLQVEPFAFLKNVMMCVPIMILYI